MERTKNVKTITSLMDSVVIERMKKVFDNQLPSAILTSDWHLREDTPVCYTGDFQEEQWNSVQFIFDLQVKYNCPVIHAGDLFHHWKPSPWLLSTTINHLPDRFFTIYGQHDLPQHNLELAYKAGIETLWAANKLTILPFCHYGQEPTEGSFLLSKFKKNILVWHKLTYQGRIPWPGCADPTAYRLLKKYPQYDLIVTGDNHKPFVEQYEDRLLVNPGSLTRQKADQINHTPRVYLWYVEDASVIPVYIPIKSNVISREHLEEKALKDNRISAFIKQLNGEWDAGLTFENNLEEFEKKNNIRKSVMEIVYRSLE